MKIAWVQDYSRRHGGAELSNKAVVSVGERLGFDVVGVTPKNFPEAVLATCDLVVVNNFWQFSDRQTRLVMEVLKQKPFVKYEHDSRELGRPEFAKRLFLNSALNVFLSPAHLARHKAALECDGMPLPLAIETARYTPVPSVKRIPGRALIVGGWAKGGKTAGSLGRYVQEYSDLEFASVGHQIPGVAVTLPFAEPANMPAIYSSAEHLVHLPDCFCAGERVIFEAALCGCKVTMNSNVGHASWGRDLTDPDGLRAWLDQAPYEFWRMIEGIELRRHAA